MPPKKGPKILVDVLEKPQALKSKTRPTQKRTVMLEKHTSYDDDGEKTTSFMAMPVSPAKRRMGETSGSMLDTEMSVQEPLYSVETVPPLTEDEIEQGNDESRILELEGFGHLAINSKMRTSRIGPAPAQRRKRNETVSWTVPYYKISDI